MLYITMLVLSALLFVFAFLFSFQVRKYRNLQDRFNESVHQSDLTRLKLEQRLQVALKLSHEIMDAHEEQEIVNILLDLSLQITGAMGISFVPLGDHGNIMASVHRGDFPFSLPDAWLEYLASPTVRQECVKCTKYEAHELSCVLLRGPFSDASGIYCFPLRYGQQELGIMNIYLPDTVRLDSSTRAYLDTLVDATTLALQSARLRQREIVTLSQMQSAREKQGLNTALMALLETLHASTEATAVVLMLTLPQFHSLKDLIEKNRAFLYGDDPDSILLFFEDHLEILHSKHGSMTVWEQKSNRTDGYTWLSVPVKISKHKTYGVVVLMDKHLHEFSPRQTKLVQSIAEQMAILLQNADMLAGLEYKIVMEERTRLSREIHDGLAQTLGFLKLQVAQMFNHLDRNDLDRLRQVMKLGYEALSMAYQDARQAIDGLRIKPDGSEGYELKNWLNQTLEDYVEGSISVDVELHDLPVQLPGEVHAQLIRIVQEALSNIRKHALAKKVRISFYQMPKDVVLEIQDDGIGFTPEDVPHPSRFGLRGMRERADLIGADFQVISQPGNGTMVRVRLPLEEKYWMEA